MKTEDFYKIGSITRVHALKGELSFSFTDDVWDRVDADYLMLFIDGIMVPFFLEEYRFRSDSVALLKFQDVDSADDAQEFVGCEVYFPQSLTPDEAPDELRWSYFTGFRVEDEAQGALGTITQVEDSTANVLFFVKGNQGELMIPAVEDFILDIDHANRAIRMRLPEGLLDLN